MIEKIEDAIIEHLLQTMPVLKTVESYAGQLEEELIKLKPKFPAAFVSYAGSELTRDGYGSTEDAAIFTVLFGASDRRGDKSRKGVNGAVELSRAGLKNLRDQTLKLDITALTPQRLRLVYNDKGMTVYGIDFATTFNLD